jgi:hypothetical protein
MGNKVFFKYLEESNFGFFGFIDCMGIFGITFVDYLEDMVSLIHDF